MSKIKISQLPVAPQALSGTEQLPIVQNVTGLLTTVKTTLNDVKSFVGAAVTPTLQQVTTLGNSTTTDIISTGGAISNTGGAIMYANGEIMANNAVKINKISNSKRASIYADNLSDDREIQVPDRAGTLALSVNGTLADSAGNISLSNIGITTLANIGASPNNYGATINTNTLNLQPADATHGGVLTTGTQSFAGNKTFNNNLVVNGLAIGKGANSVATNTSLGVSCLALSTTAQNTAVGYQALASSTAAINNTAVGFQALTSVSTGNDNTAIGSEVLRTNSTGYNNTAIGKGALAFNTTGFQNVAIGNLCLNISSTAQNNVAIGNQALQNTIANDNVGIGSQALFLNSSSTGNTAVGRGALIQASGGSNTALGYSAGSNLISGLNDTIIGYNAQPSTSSISNEITLGNSSISTLRCQVTSITSLSDERDKTNIKTIEAGIDFVNQLKPVSFDWNMRDGGKVGIADTGFIAQDLKKVQVDTGIEIPGLVYESNPEMLEASYGKLLPILVKAIQDLKAEIEDLKSKI